MAGQDSSPKSTILITGGSGSLGSKIAIELIKTQPDKYHVILICRDSKSAHVSGLLATLESLRGSFEFQTLDLLSLKDVFSFTKDLKSRISEKEIPGFEGGGIVNSAALFSWAKNDWSQMYKTNVLAPTMLVRGLLEVLGGGLVVNVGSAAHQMGTLEYLEKANVPTDKVGNEEKLTLQEGLKRYGSSKLFMLMASYAFQRRVEAVSYTLLSVKPRATGLETSS
jgi:NAD(P)-dependent dehydrogenase (short-subunit alcohol dehydrogenase family)